MLSLLDLMFEFINDIIKEITSNPISLLNPATYFNQKALGLGIKGVDEAIGELTGRNQMRGALAEQRDALREANRLQQQQFEDEQYRRFAEDRASSSAAAAAQRRGLMTGLDSGREFNSADLYIGGL